MVVWWDDWGGEKSYYHQLGPDCRRRALHWPCPISQRPYRFVVEKRPPQVWWGGGKMWWYSRKPNPTRQRREMLVDDSGQHNLVLKGRFALSGCFYFITFLTLLKLSRYFLRAGTGFLLGIEFHCASRLSPHFCSTFGASNIHYLFLALPISLYWFRAIVGQSSQKLSNVPQTETARH